MKLRKPLCHALLFSAFTGLSAHTYAASLAAQIDTANAEVGEK